MKKLLLSIFVLLTSLLSCNFPTDFSVPEVSKDANEFSKTFIDHIIKGQAESCFAMIAPDQLTDTARIIVSNVIHNIDGARLLNTKFLEATSSITNSFTGKNRGSSTMHLLAYEYQFDKGYVLFKTVVQEKDGNMYITSFDGQILKAPISEMTNFTIGGKSFKHYIVLVFMTFVPFFILVTLIAMFISKIPARKKILWFFIILLLNVCRFSINWHTGEFSFGLINLNFMGGISFSRGGMTPWFLGFNIPLGAILFWVKRQSLLIAQKESNIEKPIPNSTINATDMTTK